jgi:hypothetical protein
MRVTTAKHPATKHGGVGTPEYTLWKNIIGRCTNPNSTAWQYYGGRGIKVCDRWLKSFTDFLSDVGYRPSSDLTLDRINNNGHYEPNNVRWATRLQQIHNRRPSRSYQSSVNNLQRRCECGMISNPGAIGKHSKSKGHHVDPTYI